MCTRGTAQPPTWEGGGKIFAIWSWHDGHKYSGSNNGSTPPSPKYRYPAYWCKYILSAPMERNTSSSSGQPQSGSQNFVWAMVEFQETNRTSLTQRGAISFFDSDNSQSLFCRGGWVIRASGAFSDALQFQETNAPL